MSNKSTDRKGVRVVARPSAILFLLLTSFQRSRFFLYHLYRAIGSKYRVQSLLFLSRVARIVIAALPVYVCRSGETTPCPEVTAGQQTALRTVLAYEAEDVAVVLVAGSGGSVLGELEAVAREAELLYHDGFLVLAGHGQMLVNIGFGAFLGAGRLQRHHPGRSGLFHERTEEARYDCRALPE